MNDLKDRVIESLKKVVDPEIHMDVITGKMIEDIQVEDKSVRLKFRPISPICPIALKLAVEIKNNLMALNLFDKVNVEVIDHVLANKLNNTLEEI